jgi:GNAT superfamily N-acetyltransferase
MVTLQPVEVKSIGQLAQFCNIPGLPILDLEAVKRHNADAHWMIIDKADNISARCSLWWQNVPTYPKQGLGVIGHYAAQNATSAAELLKLAEEQLAAQNCTLAVGPMDGNTWRSYRLVVERDSEPPFFLEPDNPDDWSAHFTENGFSTFSEYFSTLNPDLSQPQPDLARITERIQQRGIYLRPFNPDHFDQELSRIYNVSLSSFSQNFLYTPIDLAEFMSAYQPIRTFIRPELILIAEHNEQTVGFLFALPDLFQARRRETVNTVIIKTVAVHPDYQMLGLGNLLVARAETIAHELGYKRAIHALMNQGNSSRKISQRHETRQIRRYALFSKSL